MQFTFSKIMVETFFQRLCEQTQKKKIVVETLCQKLYVQPQENIIYPR